MENEIELTETVYLIDILGDYLFIKGVNSPQDQHVKIHCSKNTKQFINESLELRIKNDKSGIVSTVPIQFPMDFDSIRTPFGLIDFINDESVPDTSFKIQRIK